MKVTPALIRRIHMLLPDHYKQDNELKQMLVHQYTAGRATSTKELELSEAKRLISDLLRADPTDKMRKKILSICHELGWHTPSGKLDWTRINRFCEKYGHAHKSHLNAYTSVELVRLVTQFENMLKKEYKNGSKD